MTRVSADHGWRRYYENTKNSAPRPLTVMAVDRVLNRDRAIDLGAGALNDCRFLLDQGFQHVTAIDRIAMAGKIAATLPADRFDYVITRFEDFEFPTDTFDLITAQFSLTFIEPAQFNRVFASIRQSLRRAGGIFAGHLFGVEDDWAADSSKTFQTREEVQRLFEGIMVLEFNEVSEDGLCASGDCKRWHYFGVIAQSSGSRP